VVIVDSVLEGAERAHLFETGESFHWSEACWTGGGSSVGELPMHSKVVSDGFSSATKLLSRLTLRSRSRMLSDLSSSSAGSGVVAAAGGDAARFDASPLSVARVVAECISRWNAAPSEFGSVPVGRVRVILCRWP
jgi:hypothetical protein